MIDIFLSVANYDQNMKFCEIDLKKKSFLKPIK